MASRSSRNRGCLICIEVNAIHRAWLSSNLLMCDNSPQQMHVPSMKSFVSTYTHQGLTPFIQSCPFDIFSRDERNRAKVRDQISICQEVRA
jgi:hypothetical protein